MRVAVIGAGGREQAIAWACRRHGHQVTIVDGVGEVDPAAWTS
jgi:phosphoribosylamine-glycine ligase